MDYPIVKIKDEHGKEYLAYQVEVIHSKGTTTLTLDKGIVDGGLTSVEDEITALRQNMENSCPMTDHTTNIANAIKLATADNDSVSKTADIIIDAAWRNLITPSDLAKAITRALAR